MKSIKFPRKKVESSGLLENLTDFFASENLHQIALETKFIQRSSSKIEGLAFLCLHVFENESLRDNSLSEECEFLESEFGIEVTKQSLDERYNTFAVQFMKRCFEKILTDVLIKPDTWAGFKDVFNRIRIADSTSFQLPANLSAFYQSAGGDTSPASIKIQYEFDLAAGNFLELQFGDGKRNDVEYIQNCPPIKPKDLIIKDLGYYQHNHFKTIAEGGGYFISRFKSKTNLYKKNETGSFEKVSLDDLFAGNKGLDSKCLYLGEEKLPVRVVFESVPEEVAQKRLKNLVSKAKHKKWNLSKERKMMCAFNIFITNLDENIDNQTVVLLYALRWQIELLFKIWKSLFSIHEIGHTNIFRFECYLFGRIIALCLAQNIQSLFKEHLLTKGFEPSEWKGYKILKKKF